MARRRKSHRTIRGAALLTSLIRNAGAKMGSGGLGAVICVVLAVEAL